MFALFMQADWVVKSVMIGLLLASVACWAVIFSKLAAYGRARREMKAFDRIFASGEPLTAIYQRIKDKPRAWARRPVRRRDGRVERLATPTTPRTQLACRRGCASCSTPPLPARPSGSTATCRCSPPLGSAAPFIGLFGTVWGIMNSFTAIAAAESTSLSVVAPGIAEALFATALGLLAAIPAVIAYNKLSGDAGRLIGRLEAFADRVSVLLSRQLDAKGAA